MLEDIRTHYASACGGHVGKRSVRDRCVDHFGFLCRDDLLTEQILQVCTRFVFLDRVANGVEEVHQIFVAVHLLAYDADASAAAASGFGHITALRGEAGGDHVADLAWHTSDAICHFVALQLQNTVALVEHFFNDLCNLHRIYMIFIKPFSDFYSNRFFDCFFLRFALYF